MTASRTCRLCYSCLRGVAEGEAPPDVNPLLQCCKICRRISQNAAVPVTVRPGHSSRRPPAEASWKTRRRPSQASSMCRRGRCRFRRCPPPPRKTGARMAATARPRDQAAFCPALVPSSHSIERLSGLMPKHLTHHRCFGSVRQFQRALLTFLRPRAPAEWETLCDAVSDNFRIRTSADG
jgi:hypothetical protein